MNQAQQLLQAHRDGHGVRVKAVSRVVGDEAEEGNVKMPKTAEELKAELVQATLNTWIDLVREKGYENTDLGDAIDTLLRRNPEFFKRVREAAPSEVPNVTHFKDDAEVALWLAGEMGKLGKRK